MRDNWTTYSLFAIALQTQYSADSGTSDVLVYDVQPRHQDPGKCKLKDKASSCNAESIRQKVKRVKK